MKAAITNDEEHGYIGIVSSSSADASADNSKDEAEGISGLAVATMQVETAHVAQRTVQTCIPTHWSLPQRPY